MKLFDVWNQKYSLIQKILINVQMIFVFEDIVFAHFIWQAAEYVIYCACVAVKWKETQYLCIGPINTSIFYLFTLEHRNFSKSYFQIRHEICGNHVKIRYFANHRFLRHHISFKNGRFLLKKCECYIFQFNVLRFYMKTSFT